MISFLLHNLFKARVNWIFLAFLVTTITLRIVFTQIARGDARKHQIHQLGFEAERFRDLMASRMDHYVLSLYSARALFTVQPDVTRTQWSEYGKSMDIFRRFPGASSLTYLKRVTSSEVSKHLETIRNDRSVSKVGYPNARFYPEPIQEGQDALIITYLYPSTVNTDYLGFNYLSKPERYQSVMKAVEINSEIATPMLEAPTNRTSLFAILLPIYDTSLPSVTTFERKSAWTGIVSIGFSATTLFSELFSEASFTAPTVVEVFEGEKIDDASKIYRYSTLPEGTEIGENERMHSEVQILTVGKQIWTLRFLTIISNSYTTATIPIYQSLILLLFFLLTLTSAIFVRRQINSHLLTPGVKNSSKIS